MEKRKSHVELNKVYFWTSTIKDWVPILKGDSLKEVIISSLQYLVKNKKIKVYAFVIMPNHVHFLWEMVCLNGKEMPHTSFRKYTAHKFLKLISNSDSFKVKSLSRSHQFWQRDALAIEVDSIIRAENIIDYIHLNPLQEKWSLVQLPEEFKWSSASFYMGQTDEFKILTHYKERF